MSKPRWKIGDKVAMKLTEKGYVTVLEEDAQKLFGLKNLDGWSIVTVVADEPVIESEVVDSSQSAGKD